MDWNYIFALGGAGAVWFLKNIIVKEYEEYNWMKKQERRVRDANLLSPENYENFTKMRCLYPDDLADYKENVPITPPLLFSYHRKLCQHCL
jgi:hypothetical protein